jgi:hypothetical protein
MRDAGGRKRVEQRSLVTSLQFIMQTIVCGARGPPIGRKAVGAGRGVEGVGHDWLLKRKRPARWPGVLGGWKGGAGRLMPSRCVSSLSGDYVRLVGFLFASAFLVVGEEGGQCFGVPGGVAIRCIGCRVRAAQRLGQPAGVLKQPLGFLRHLGFLQVVDELG